MSPSAYRQNRLLRALALATLPCMLAGLVACGDQTGVLLEVTREGTATQGIERLRFFIGVQAPGEAGAPGDFVGEPDPDTDVVLLEGRDILDDPYDLLLKRDGAGAMDLAVAVAGFAGDELIGFGGLEQPIPFVDGQVVQWEIVLRGDRGDRVDVTDLGCLVWTTDTGKVVIVSTNDMDCDDDPTGLDCDDSDPTIGPSQQELCANNVDDDCDGETDEQEDADNDGVLNCDDCDDQDNHRFPGNTEVCDSIDNDCNGICDDGPLDFDGDNFNVCGTVTFADGTCSEDSEDLVDCDDNEPTTNPDAIDICDGVDNNCDEECDENSDPDGDKYTFCGSNTAVCDGTHDGFMDCEPNEESAFPGNAPEFCDGFDNDCDGRIYPDTVPCYDVVNLMGEDNCFIGTRSCDDTVGIGWTGACVVTAGDPGQAVPMELCLAYDSCTAAADPYACANAAVATQTINCTIFFDADDPSKICAPASAILPTSGVGECFWSVIGARKRQEYDVVLADLMNGGSDNTVFTCNPIFQVLGTFAVPPRSDGYLLMESIDLVGQEILLINLNPMPAIQCPPNGLQCAGLTTPPAG